MRTDLVKRTDNSANVVEKAAAMLQEVKLQLPEVEDVKLLLDLRANADALKTFLRQRDAALTAQLDAAEIKLRTERRLGQLLAEAPTIPNDGSRNSQVRPTDLTPKSEVLKEMGIKKQRASEWQKLAAVKDEDFEKHAAAIRSKAENLTAARTTLFSEESDQWYTPPQYIDTVRAVLHGIDLDPATNAKANEIVKAKRIFTIDDDGLKHRWKGRVFCNPPYSDIAAFTKKMVSEYTGGHMAAGIYLVNANTEADWFKPLYDFPICFTDHRIKFLTPAMVDGAPVKGSALKGSAFVYFGQDVRAFVSAFRVWGAIVGRLR